MASDTNKRNIFIGAGYCLAAIIIIVNYHYSNSASLKKQKPITAVNQLEQLRKTDADSDLRKQLAEERKLNLEMRDMITRMQSGMSPKQGQTKVPAASFDEVIKTSIPELRANFSSYGSNKRANPFIKGKNPFHLKKFNEDLSSLSLTKRTEASFLLKPNAFLPFVISGCGSKFGYISNN